MHLKYMNCRLIDARSRLVLGKTALVRNQSHSLTCSRNDPSSKEKPMETSASLLSGGLAPHPSPRPGRGGERERESALMIHRMQAARQAGKVHRWEVEMRVTTSPGSQRQRERGRIKVCVSRVKPVSCELI